MRHRYSLLFIAVFFFALLVQNISAYSFPEKLEYDVTWLGISVGNAVIEAEQKGQQIHYSARATTGKWISYLYPVDDTLSSIHESRQLKARQKGMKEIPLHYVVKLNEDKIRVSNEIVFNPGKKM